MKAFGFALGLLVESRLRIPQLGGRQIYPVSCGLEPHRSCPIGRFQNLDNLVATDASSYQSLFQRMSHRAQPATAITFSRAKIGDGHLVLVHQVDEDLTHSFGVRETPVAHSRSIGALITLYVNEYIYLQQTA